VLAARLATAAVLIAGLLGALFYLPSLWLKLVTGAVVALGVIAVLMWTGGRLRGAAQRVDGAPPNAGTTRRRGAAT